MLTSRPLNTIMMSHTSAVMRVPIVWFVTVALNSRATDVPAKLVSKMFNTKKANCAKLFDNPRKKK